MRWNVDLKKRNRNCSLSLPSFTSTGRIGDSPSSLHRENSQIYIPPNPTISCWKNIKAVRPFVSAARPTNTKESVERRLPTEGDKRSAWSVSQSVGSPEPPESHQTDSSKWSPRRRPRTALLLDSVLVEPAETSREVPAQRDGQDVDEAQQSEGVQQHHRVGQEGERYQNKRQKCYRDVKSRVNGQIVESNSPSFMFRMKNTFNPLTPSVSPQHIWTSALWITVIPEPFCLFELFQQFLKPE